MKKINLTQGYKVSVDSGDYAMLSKYKWHVFRVKRKNGELFYAVRSKEGNSGTEYMHRTIMGRIPKGFDIDHIDRNGLNNCRSNLRIVTRSQNNFNRNHYGVHASLHKRSQKWYSSFKVNGKSIHLGTFSTKKDAMENSRIMIKIIDKVNKDAWHGK